MGCEPDVLSSVLVHPVQGGRSRSRTIRAPLGSSISVGTYLGSVFVQVGLEYGERKGGGKDGFTVAWLGLLVVIHHYGIFTSPIV